VLLLLSVDKVANQQQPREKQKNPLQASQKAEQQTKENNPEFCLLWDEAGKKASSHDIFVSYSH